MAIVANKRSSRAPDVPAVTEVLPGYKLLKTLWGFWAPAGVPQPILARLSAEIQKGFKDPEIVAKLDALDVQAAGSTPQEFAAEIKEQIMFIEEFMKAAGIKPE